LNRAANADRDWLAVLARSAFDFVFLIDGKEENRGNETWQLVKRADGWRIAAITYSSTPHAQQVRRAIVRGSK